MKLGIKHPSLTILPDYTDEKEKLPKREGGHKLWHFSSFPSLLLLPTVVTQNHILSCSPQYILLAHFILGFSREASICQHWLTFWLRSSDTSERRQRPSGNSHFPHGKREALGWGLQKSPATSSEARAAYQEHSPPGAAHFIATTLADPFGEEVSKGGNWVTQSRWLFSPTWKWNL